MYSRNETSRRSDRSSPVQFDELPYSLQTSRRSNPVVYNSGETRTRNRIEHFGKSKANYAQGVSVHHTSKSSSLPGYDPSTIAKKHHKTTKSLLLQNSKYTAKIDSSLPQVRISKPCKITFTMENSLPIERDSEISWTDTIVDTTQKFETFSEKRIEGKGDCYMEGIIIQHNSRPTSVSDMSMYSGNYRSEQTERVSPETVLPNVRKSSSTDAVEDIITETIVEKRDETKKRMSRTESLELQTAAAKAEKENVIITDTTTTVTETTIEPEWKVMREWRTNENGEREEKEVKLVKNNEGAWVQYDTFYGKSQPALVTTGHTEERQSGDEWVRKHDGTMERVEYYWIQDSTDNWQKMDKNTNEVLVVEDVNHYGTGEYSTQQYSTTSSSKGVTFMGAEERIQKSTSAPVISGEYWIQRKKDKSWKRIQYHWAQGADGNWQKIDSIKGKVLPSNGHWKYGHAWELNKKAVPKQVAYEWKEDHNGQWRMISRSKSHHPVDTSWQQGTEWNTAANGVDKRTINYRWVQDSRGNWLKLDQATGHQIETVKKGRGIDITRNETTYIYHTDKQKLVKQSTTNHFKGGKLVSHDTKNTPLTGDESSMLMREAAFRQPPPLGELPQKHHGRHIRSLGGGGRTKIKKPVKTKSRIARRSNKHVNRTTTYEQQPATSSISPYNPLPGTRTSSGAAPPSSYLQNSSRHGSTIVSQTVPPPRASFQSATAPVVNAFQ